MTTASLTVPQQRAMERRQKTDKLRDLLVRQRESIAALVPKHLTAEKLTKLALMAISREPGLLECSPESILRSVMIAGQLGLDIGTPLGSAYLIPFRNNKTGRDEAMLLPGYRGLIDLARRGGELEQIEAHVVHERDVFEFEFGLEPKLRHVPAMQGDPGRPIATYCIARLKDGGVHVEVLTENDIEKIRAFSRGGTKPSSPWVTWPDEMRKKSAIRRAAKFLPLSIEKSAQFAAAVGMDEEAESGKRSHIEGLLDLPELAAGEDDDDSPVTVTAPAAIRMEPAPPGSELLVNGKPIEQQGEWTPPASAFDPEESARLDAQAAAEEKGEAPPAEPAPRQSRLAAMRSKREGGDA